jgi:uncharacterized membrane protein YjdF
VIGALATLAFCGISFSSGGAVAKYRYSFLFLIPILWAVYALRRRLLLRPVQFALFAAALVLHDLGAFGWYQRRVWGIKFDWCVHFVFGAIGASILVRLLWIRLGARGRTGAVLTVLVLMGLGAIHEIVEAASTMVLGTEYGMVIIGPDNPFDTQQDLMANLLGALLALAVARRDPLVASDGQTASRSS